MNHNSSLKVESLMARAGLRADKIPIECQLSGCTSRVTYLLIDYVDPKFYPRGVCEDHANEYRRAQWKREEEERKNIGEKELPDKATCGICQKPQFVNEYNLVTCLNGHIGARTIIPDMRKGPEPTTRMPDADRE